MVSLTVLQKNYVQTSKNPSRLIINNLVYFTKDKNNKQVYFNFYLVIGNEFPVIVERDDHVPGVPRHIDHLGLLQNLQHALEVL
jgi:hypothetical protein